VMRADVMVSCSADRQRPATRSLSPLCNNSRQNWHSADLDVIVTSGPQPVRALLAANTKTPIVFAILADPITDGFVQSLSRPGGNITGLSMSGTDLESKRLEVLKHAVPTISKVMVLHDPSMGPTGQSEVKTGARFLGLELFSSSRRVTMPNSQKPSSAWPPKA
jgi:ABC-type uncharacterized transport system substrate-binding protein